MGACLNQRRKLRGSDAWLYGRRDKVETIVVALLGGKESTERTDDVGGDRLGGFCVLRSAPPRRPCPHAYTCTVQSTDSRCDPRSSRWRRAGQRAHLKVRRQ